MVRAVCGASAHLTAHFWLGERKEEEEEGSKEGGKKEEQTTQKNPSTSFAQRVARKWE